MYKVLIKRVLSISFILSLLLHLLLLLSISTFIILQQPKENKKIPDLYTPSYVYKGGTTAKPAPQKTQAKQQVASANSQIPTSYQAQKPSQKTKNQRRSVLAMTNDFLQQNQHDTIAHLKQEQDPIYLIGDKNSPVDPLVRLLGAALSAHFDYPREEGMFGIRGKAIIGLTLHPNGRLSNVQLLQSTDNQDLDSAALYAVNAAPIVRGADKFISEPKYFVIGFIFR